MNEAGLGQVLLDGQPLETVAVSFSSEAGEPTEVTLVVPAIVDINTEVDNGHLVHARRQA